MNSPIDDILSTNAARHAAFDAPFDPVSGLGSVGKRFLFSCPDFPIPQQWLPSSMASLRVVRMLADAGSVDAFCHAHYPDVPLADTRAAVIKEFIMARIRHDFPYWCASFVYVKPKGGGDDVLFRLNWPQRLLVARLEALRLSDTPIRIILLKARQWGGSTVIQLYMAWLQLCHRKGLNSLIIAHQSVASDEIKFMFDRMMAAYPAELLHAPGENYALSEPKLKAKGKSGAISRVPARSCDIKLGTAERPDSCRGGDYNLVHLSEVGLWKLTDGKRPADIVRSACSGVMFKPYTMIVYESTANGVGNFFHREYIDARDNPASQFSSFFISWFDIEQNQQPIPDVRAFAQRLYDERLSDTSPSNRQEPGRYLWWLWQKGATLEGIYWYVMERAKHTDHGSMAAECPSDDTEAFVNSGQAVFDKYQVVALQRSCRDPLYVGEIYGQALTGPDALADIRFRPDSQGALAVWSLPDSATPADGCWLRSDPDPTEQRVSDRYLVVVDIGGRSAKADFSVIVVFDRLHMVDTDGIPSVVAQWRGHIDMDLLAWKAAQVAAFYDDALLVIESNTLETHDRDRQVDGDLSSYILSLIKSQYPNLYARRQSEEDIREGRPRKYGFHTNTATKPKIIGTLIRCVRDGLYVERDIKCIDELLSYERKQNGSMGAIVGAHDDILMTRAIGLHICFHEMDMPRLIDPAPLAPTPRYNPAPRSAASLFL